MYQLEEDHGGLPYPLHAAEFRGLRLQHAADAVESMEEPLCQRLSILPGNGERKGKFKELVGGEARAETVEESTA
jgi:hypothetical protein